MKTYLMRFKRGNATHVLIQTDERTRNEIGYYKKQNGYWSAYATRLDPDTYKPISRDWHAIGVYTTHQKARQAIVEQYLYWKNNATYNW